MATATVSVHTKAAAASPSFLIGGNTGVRHTRRFRRFVAMKAGGRRLLSSRGRAALFSSWTKTYASLPPLLPNVHPHPAAEALSSSFVLAVNTASLCGYTPQLGEMEELHRKLHRPDDGVDGERPNFTVLALPCNQFGEQEPGDALEILQFYKDNYDVTFPVTRRCDVILGGESGVNPLHARIAEEYGEGLSPDWNFQKLLIGPGEQGLLSVWAPGVAVSGDMAAEVERLVT